MNVEALLAPCVFQCIPNDLTSYKKMIERISYLLENIECFDFIVPVIPRDIFDELMGQWPYNVDGNQKIDNQSIDSGALILAFTDQRLKKPKYSYSVTENTKCCTRSTINDKWLGFITAWKKASSNQKGIYPTNGCSIDEIEGIKVVHELNTWKLLAFPWLAKTDDKLPIAGNEPYVPPKNWARMNLKRKIKIKGEVMYGYIDINNAIWVWDKMHNDHWDVQQNGSYRKVYVGAAECDKIY